MCIFSVFSSEIFWTAITALATIVIAIIAQNQLSKTNTIASLTCLIDFKNSFFTEQQRVFVLLIENQWLIFAFEGNQGLFNNKAPKKFKDKFKHNEFLNRGHFLTQEVDDYLIGNFEDAALLEKNGVISEKDAEQNFGYYLKLTCENEEIKKYVKWIQEDDPDVYGNMFSLYKKLNPQSLK
jgi:hypothetical protein